MGRHSNDISPFLILYVTNTFMMFICLVRLMLDDIPFRVRVRVKYYIVSQNDRQPHEV